ncbi:trans-sulfuration enzyme family protein [Mediterraneibacter gnavus]|uniref:trans-sulfuration enzyme family protein n=1 Tax=Mediterraneibacter gnavus TaxID=33038 RepID=UPI0023305FA2|nr:PLP-dependent aspartate aminotransferase family protein [Mediterraneibacter gnavus]MDB8711194.1 PLP-dependent aspartate aminotransferase family protein [Mediterraneibacter gnavus]MDB8713571.1 PLP-dependent aspartate aminotransferase family protein [Mediterraneibacter gnavus]
MTENQDLLAMTHVGEDPKKYMGAVTPPVFMNSLHVFDTVKDYFDVDIFNDEYYYGRASNPTVTILEKKLAALEHGSRAVVFSAGMAACAAAILAVCKTGSHIICVRESYGPVQHLLDEFLHEKMDVEVTYVVGKEVEEFEEAIRPETDMIILESPSTLVCNVVDLQAVAKLARRHGIKTYIDNTYSTPVFQKPLDFGIDIVMHTMTKYIGGHSDLIGGVLISKDDGFMKKIMVQRDWFGGVLGPMEAWLAIRGLRTLDVRMQRHYETGMKVAEFLENHPKVERVFYTGLSSHPQYDLARKQQKGECGLLSIEIKGDTKNVETFVDNLKIFEKGCSWGGFESLAIAFTYNWSEEELRFHGLNRNIVRLHCGLEGTENLIEDLKQALDKI